MDGESQREGFKAHAVRRAAVPEPETRDQGWRTKNRDRIPALVEHDESRGVRLNADNGLADFVVVRKELVAARPRAVGGAGLVVDPGAADVQEKSAANTADDADRRQRGVD